MGATNSRPTRSTTTRISRSERDPSMLVLLWHYPIARRNFLLITFNWDERCSNFSVMKIPKPDWNGTLRQIVNSTNATEHVLSSLLTGTNFPNHMPPAARLAWCRRLNQDDVQSVRHVSDGVWCFAQNSAANTQLCCSTVQCQAWIMMDQEFVKIQ